MEICSVCRQIGGYHAFWCSRQNVEVEFTTTANVIAPPDPVNHPSHYTSDPSGVECIEITRWLNFDLGNAFKYVFRAGSKRLSYQDADMAAIGDLEKACFYLVDEMDNVLYLGMMMKFEVLQNISKVIGSRSGSLKRFFECIYVALICCDEVIYHAQLRDARQHVLDHIETLKK